jgi:hypothetical protein
MTPTTAPTPSTKFTPTFAAKTQMVFLQHVDTCVQHRWILCNVLFSDHNRSVSCQLFQHMNRHAFVRQIRNE